VTRCVTRNPSRASEQWTRGHPTTTAGALISSTQINVDLTDRKGAAYTNTAAVDDHGHGPKLAESSAVGFSISVDTEEDAWEPATRNITTLNIREIPRLQRLFERLGIRTTFFVTYQVASDPTAAAIIRETLTSEGVEVGAHLHPWNTPPFEGREEQCSMLWRYPQDSQASKIVRLKQLIHENIGVEPTAFRAGRFGLGNTSLGALEQAGFRVDSSVTPLLSWRASGGPSFLRAPLRVYRPSAADLCVPAYDGKLVEVPLTIGFTRFRQSHWKALAKSLYGPFAQRMHLPGLVNHALDLRRVILSPETDTVPDMLAASRRIIDEGGRNLHMYFHSNSLVPGLTPFVRTTKDLEAVYASIERYLDGLSAFARVEPRTVSEEAAAFELQTAV
jgi:hypothetical protein